MRRLAGERPPCTVLCVHNRFPPGPIHYQTIEVRVSRLDEIFLAPRLHSLILSVTRNESVLFPALSLSFIALPVPPGLVRTQVIQRGGRQVRAA